MRIRTRRAAGKKLLTLVIIACIATAAAGINYLGRLIALNLIQPVVSVGTDASASSQTEKLTVSPITVYYSGEGFTLRSDASARAAEYAENDGAGLVFELDGAYNAVEKCGNDAQSGENTFVSKGFTVTLTGTKAQISAVKAAFSLLSEAVTATLDMAQQVGDGSLSALKCVSEINTLEERLTSEKELLDDLNSGNSVIKALKEMYSCALCALDELPSASSAAFLQRLRFASASLACEYVRFCNNIA